MRLRAFLPAEPGVAQALAIASSDNYPEFGVGFSFTNGYGVASVYYANGTLVNVAKVEGDGEYKRCMRMIAGGEPERCGPSNSGLSAMVEELKDATEARTRSSIGFVNPSSPYHSNLGSCVDIGRDPISQALRQASLSASPCARPSGKFAAMSFGIGERNWDPWVSTDDRAGDTPVVPVIEYTREALSVSVWLWTEYESQLGRQFHEASFGTAALDACYERETEEACNGEMEDAIRWAMETPLTFGKSYGNLDDFDFFDYNLDGVVIFGEASDDRRLLDIVERILEEKSALRYFDVPTFRNDPSVAAFSASMGAARYDWWFGMEVITGRCRLQIEPPERETPIGRPGGLASIWSSGLAYTWDSKPAEEEQYSPMTTPERLFYNARIGVYPEELEDDMKGYPNPLARRLYKYCPRIPQISFDFQMADVVGHSSHVYGD